MFVKFSIIKYIYTIKNIYSIIMILSTDKNNLSNAYNNQNLYYKLSDEQKSEWINNIYNYYNKSLPIIIHNLQDIKYSFNLLCNNQNYSLFESCNDFSLFEKYNFNNLIKFIKSNYIKKDINKNIKNSDSFLNYNLIIYDDDYLKHYVHICTLSDFYQNNERVNCRVINSKTPYDYYKDNYQTILDKYFKLLGKKYEAGLLINELTFDLTKEQYKKSINPLYLQNNIYANNRFCTVFKPYLFKLLINLFKVDNNTIILDLSSGWGDRLLAALSLQNEIKKYIGIDPNTNLLNGYNKMISDLSEEKNINKFMLIQKPAENVDYVSLDSNIDIIFWSPPFFDQETYVKQVGQSIETFINYDDWEDNFLINVINISTNNLKLNGVLILYLGHINYDTFMKKMNNISKLKYIGKLYIMGDKMKEYYIFVKIKKYTRCQIINTSDGIPDKINKIKEKLINYKANPRLKIIKLNLDNKKIYVVQDSFLIAGTKQRVAALFIRKYLKHYPNVQKLTYSGTWNGYGAIATAFAAYKLNLQSEVFLSEIATGFDKPSNHNTIINSKQINTLLALNAKIHLCPTYRIAKDLEYDITTLPSINSEIWTVKSEYFNVPLGLNDNKSKMIKLLAKKMKKAAKNSYLTKIPNKRFWLVSGTAGIAQAINLAFPNSKLFIFLTGGGKHIKKVIEWTTINKNITILNYNNEFNVKEILNDYDKYYESVHAYDSNIWPYVKKYALDGDIIWNVASN